MEILFCDEDFQKLILDKRALTRKYGSRMADLIWQRLSEMIAADNLVELKMLPAARLHPLVGNRKGQFSVDLVHPLRLLFEAANDRQSKKPDGTVIWERVTKIRILEIADTHE